MAEVLGSHHGDLSVHGLKCSGNIHWNLSVEELVELAVSRGEGVYSAHKALVTETGERTGRSPNDKFIVDEPTTSSDVNWGDVNVSTDMATFTKMRAKVIDYLSNQEDLFVQDLYCGADMSEALPIRALFGSAESVVFPVPDKPKNIAVLSPLVFAEQCIGSMPFFGNIKFITEKIDFLISPAYLVPPINTSCA